MAHKQQQDFFERVKEKFPEHFENVVAVDFGSFDFNGSLKPLFKNSTYIGVDIIKGKNVDIVGKAHDFGYFKKLDTIVSGEMLEHDEYWDKSLKNMYELLRSGGLLAISCAGKGRAVHGTKKSGKGHIWGTSPNYYRNITEEDIVRVLDNCEGFSEWKTDYNASHKDTYFYGIKK